RRFRGRLPLVGADESRRLDVPAGFLQRFAPRRVEQRFIRFQVAGGLVQHDPAAHLFLDHEQAPVAHDDAGDGDVGLPELSAAVIQVKALPGPEVRQPILVARAGARPSETGAGLELRPWRPDLYWDNGPPTRQRARTRA